MFLDAGIHEATVDMLRQNAMLCHALAPPRYATMRVLRDDPQETAGPKQQAGNLSQHSAAVNGPASALQQGHEDAATCERWN